MTLKWAFLSKPVFSDAPHVQSPSNLQNRLLDLKDLMCPRSWRRPGSELPLQVLGGHSRHQLRPIPADRVRSLQRGHRDHHEPHSADEKMPGRGNLPSRAANSPVGQADAVSYSRRSGCTYLIEASRTAPPRGQLSETPPPPHERPPPGLWEKAEGIYANPGFSHVPRPRGPHVGGRAARPPHRTPKRARAGPKSR